MIFGLPLLTFFLAIGAPVISVILSLVFVFTFDEGDHWLTVEDIIEKFRKGR
ncbi:hypothetical protein [Lactonifactor longoviformis]|uniref:Putative solute:sodium symporter small subunit n=1 Tax=Lactonifactor longoviformis DSM 17459 TaxID=1122155 RepID=A0A1M4SVM3_9CLOT|nr:hypothetical protein [Lactonifactor longoviformis]SHE36258.1 putative solute:sodium symporter small subunit [Lactonifactor longoviformis DSM 17459]